jgi:RNA polymerase sigma factor (sigma-70 family)
VRRGAAAFQRARFHLLGDDWPDLSQNRPGERCSLVDARSDAAAVGVTFNEAGLANETRFDLETIFHAQYRRMCRVIARVIRDPARAEELAVEVFLKWSRHPNAHGDKAEGWLYRTAVREALDELRRQTHRSRYERLFSFIPSGKARSSPTPEDVRAAKEDQETVRLVLSLLDRRQAQLLLLRSEGFSYQELASTLDLSPASVGTLLARAQQAFRKEYIKRYGEA